MDIHGHQAASNSFVAVISKVLLNAPVIRRSSDEDGPFIPDHEVEVDEMLYRQEAEGESDARMDWAPPAPCLPRPDLSAANFESSVLADRRRRREMRDARHEVEVEALMERHARERAAGRSQSGRRWREGDDAATARQALHAWRDSALAAANESGAGKRVAEAILDRHGALLEALIDGQTLLFQEPEHSPLKEPSISGSNERVFPPHVLNVDGKLGEICDWLNATAHVRQPVLTLGATLVTLGGLFGRRYRVVRSNTMTNLLGIGIVRTGGGKDHARKALKRLLVSAQCQRFLMGDGATSGAAIWGALGGYPVKVGYFDEFGRELQEVNSFNSPSFAKSKLTAIMKLYSDAGGVSLGTEYADQKSKPRVDVHFPSLSIWGTTTGESLYGALSSADAASGFLNRFIVLEGDDNATMRRLFDDAPATSDAPPPDLVEWVSEVVSFVPPSAGNLASMHVGDVAPGFFIDVRVDDQDAKALLNQVQEEQEALLRGRGDARTRDLWARYVENTIKVAAIRAIAEDYRQPTITAVHASWARDLVRWSIVNLSDAMRTHVADSQHEREVQLVLNFLRSAGGEWVTKDKIGRGVQSLPARRRADILNDLVEQSVVDIAKHQPATGRPSVRYRYVG